MSRFLFLHGFVGTGEDFAEVAKDLTGALAPDWPGHGSLAALRQPSDYNLDAHLQRLEGWLGAMAHESPTLVGYSMGGRLLQHGLARRGGPPPNARVVLVSTFPGLSTVAERSERQHADAAVARLLREQGMTRFLHYWHWQTFFKPMLELPQEKLAPIIRRRSSADPQGLALSLEGVGTGSIDSTWDHLASLGDQVDLVVGERDPRYVDHAQQMARRLPHARLHIIPGAGHALHLEQPEALRAIILNRAL